MEQQTQQPQEKATLTLGDTVIELPVYIGTEGEKVIDINGIYDSYKLTTYDPSLSNTAVCRSKITYIDGDSGVLRYRGIPIEQFNQPGPNFIEVAWTLIFGRLPNTTELSDFRNRLTENELIHEGLRRQFNEIPPKSPPMAILSAMLSQLACYYEKFLPLGDDDLFIEAAARLISKARTIAAYSYRRSKGLPFNYPDPNLRYGANFLHMMFSIPHQQYVISEEVEDALNLILILHADHEQNCSTATVRVVGSARANLFASCAAGVSALWGPRHGGANVEVMKMLEDIHKGGLTPESCIEAAKDKTNPFLLYGFGHRVYKNYDPRAKVLKDACDKVFGMKHNKDPLLDIARKLEEIALKDPYFIERKLYPNVDFYSGILLRAMGIPTNMFTVIFAIGRLPGWIAQWKEQHDDTTQRIIRPRQLYEGNTISEYVPIEERNTDS
ncbi:MAG: citrate synthase [Planctomycetaceae bacterium]|jgi:citrate synthase|nr:citrate synthase [Planctomycetaceae bacterium]